MHFLSQGDFNFPFHFVTYWVKHAYIWSFQSGTPNPDGLIRLPGRVFNFIAFILFGNMGASYFYIFAPLIICFISFFYFARNVLLIKRKSILITGSLFFALNPIFLGNVAKIGLVLAAAMLPFCFLAIKAAFEKRQFRYFLLYIICINISFLHPYTFTVNIAVSGCYFLYMAWKHKAFVIDKWYKFIFVGIVAVLLNLYFALPMASMGSVSKDMISTNITPTPIDYTALVGISNTGNFFTGFSLSKNVFLDFDFYNGLYQNLYFFGVFLLYVIILGLFLYVEKTLKPEGRRQIGLLFGAFLILIALAATTVMHIDTLIKMLISMPGGWAFRSPLKWQLYIPMALFGILVLVLAQVKNKRMFTLAQTLLLVSFVIMNGYLFLDLYRKILVPRTLTNFAALEKMDMDQQTVLFVNNGDCMDYLRKNPRVNTELNQVFTSKSTQLKHVLIDDVDSVNLGSYDYLLTCKEGAGIREAMAGYDFKGREQFAGNSFHLYQNQKSTKEIYSPGQVYGLANAQNISNKYDFVTNVEHGLFNFAQPTADSIYPVTSMQDIFETLTPKAINGNTITTMLPAVSSPERQLFVRGNDTAMYYRQTDNGITFSSTQQPGMQALEDDGQGVPLPGNRAQTVSFTGEGYKYENLIDNPSLENGLWQKNVDDCYNFDNQPDISMRLDTANASQGRQSLELDAKQHIACTGPDRVAVKEGQHYLLSFDYQSLQGKYAGYYVSYDDPLKTNNIVRMQEDTAKWKGFSQELTAPKGAKHMTIKLYAYPHTYGEKTSKVHYDNLSLINIPPMQDRFYALTAPKAEIRQPERIDYSIEDPTKKTVRVTGATTGFYLADIDSFHPLWRLRLASSKTPIASSDHIRLNNTMNAWYVDPAKICKAQGDCNRNSDGTYDMNFVIEFTPQKYFYIGALVSGLTFIGCVIYFVRGVKKSRREGEGYKL